MRVCGTAQRRYHSYSADRVYPLVALGRDGERAAGQMRDGALELDVPARG